MPLLVSSHITRMAVPQEEQFLEAFNLHSDALFRHAFFRLSDRERALDLTQDCFMKAWDYVRGGGEVRQSKSFLFRILNNLIIDEYRRHKQESLEVALEDESETKLGLVEGSREEVEEAFDTQIAVASVRSAVEELPEEYRTVVTLRFMEGMTPREIARIIGTSENVVSVRIHRAISKLRSICSYG